MAAEINTSQILSNVSEFTEETGCSFQGFTTFDSIWKLLEDANCNNYTADWSIILLFFYLLTIFIGLLGNCLVLIEIICKSTKQSTANLLVISLTVADLLVIIFCGLPTLLTNLFKPWLLGEIMCKAVSYIQGVSVFSSAYSLLAITIYRYLLLRPLIHQSALSKVPAQAWIGTIWLTGLLITFPKLYTFQIEHFADIGPSCQEVWTNTLNGKIYYVVVHLLVCYTLPLVLIIIFLCKILTIISSVNSPEVEAFSSHLCSSHVNCLMPRVAKFKMRKLLISMAIKFGICGLPLCIVMTRLKLFGQPDLSSTWEIQMIQIAIPIAQYLVICNSCLNPVLYAICNENFRQNLKLILFSVCGKCSVESPVSDADEYGENTIETQASVAGCVNSGDPGTRYNFRMNIETPLTSRTECPSKAYSSRNSQYTGIKETAV